MKRRVFRGILLFIALCGILTVFGQESERCLNVSQVTRFQSSTVRERQEQLSKMGYILISNESDMSLVWHNENLKVAMTSYRRQTGYENEFLTIYYDNIRIITEYIASPACISKIKEDCQSLPHIGTHQYKSGNITDIYFSNGLSIEFTSDSAINNYQRVRCYSNSDIDSIRLANELAGKNKNKQQHELDNQVNEHIAIADSIAQLEQYEEAIQLLEEVYNFSPSMIPTIEQRLGTYKQLLKQKKIHDYSVQADELYKNEHYRDALAMYNKVLNEDMNDSFAQERVDIILKKMNVINNRIKITFDYKEICPDNYDFIKNSMERQLNTLMTTIDKGVLNYDFIMNFDTFAINQSYYDIKSYDLEQNNELLFNVRDSLLHLVSHPRLTPSYIEGIPVASLSTFHVKSAWNTQEITVIKKANRNIFRGDNSYTPAIDNVLNHDSTLYKGKYNFLIKNKQVNDNLYQDISITKYKKVGGEAFVYGLIPGLGTLLATQGKEGVTYMAVSLACYIGAGVSYYYYKKFEKELNTLSSEMTEEQLQDVKADKDICKWTSIAGVSIGASFHLAGMIHALVRGIQNTKASRELRKALREEPYPIQSEEVHVK